MTYTDCMIDFETLGLGANAVATQFGYAFFDKLDGTKPMLTGSFELSLAEQISMGRTICASTIEFWRDQDAVLFQRVMTGSKTVLNALSAFGNDWAKSASDDTLLWGNGAAFDQPVLETLYEHMNQSHPWNFRQSACMRTRLRDHPVDRVKPRVPHDAMEDAIAQAKTIIASYAL